MKREHDSEGGAGGGRDKERKIKKQRLEGHGDPRGGDDGAWACVLVCMCMSCCLSRRSVRMVVLTRA